MMNLASSLPACLLSAFIFVFAGVASYRPLLLYLRGLEIMKDCNRFLGKAAIPYLCLDRLAVLPNVTADIRIPPTAGLTIRASHFRKKSASVTGYGRGCYYGLKPGTYPELDVCCSTSHHPLHEIFFRFQYG